MFVFCFGAHVINAFVASSQTSKPLHKFNLDLCTYLKHIPYISTHKRLSIDSQQLQPVKALELKMSTYRTYRFCPNCDEYHKVEEVNEIPTCVFPPNRCTRCKTLGHLTKNHDRRYELKILEVQRDNSGISQNRHHTTRRNNAPRGGHSSTRQRNRGGNQSNRSRGTSNSHRHRNSARNQVQRAQSPVPNHR